MALTLACSFSWRFILVFSSATAESGEASPAPFPMGESSLDVVGLGGTIAAGFAGLVSMAGNQGVLLYKEGRACTERL